jgi:predicted  nucleic acid-binding Zn-ribbon protein
MEMNVSHLSYDTASRSQRFLQHVNELRESIDQLQRRISALHEKQANILSQTVVGPDDKVAFDWTIQSHDHNRRNLKEQLSTLIDEIKQHIRSLRPRVRRIEEDLSRDEADAPTEFRTGAELRIRRNQCEMLKLRLNDLLVLFNKAQLEYKQRVSSMPSILKLQIWRLWTIKNE